MTQVLRYLVRIDNAGLGASPASISSLKRRLSALGLPKHENIRVSRVALELDLYEASQADLVGDLSKVEAALGPALSVRNLSAPETPRSVDRSMALARAMYMEERFWEFHEELEYQWKKLRRGEPEKEALHGLILLAAAYVHKQKGEEGVALSIIGRSRAGLEAYGGDEYRGIDVTSLKRMLAEMERAGRVDYVDLPSA